MKNFLAWFVAFPIAAIVVAFALDNRAAVDLGMWPLPWRIDVPIYVAVLGGVLLGFLGGALIAWLHGASARRLSRQRRRRIDQLERELATAKAETSDRKKPPQPDLPRIAAGGGR